MEKERSQGNDDRVEVAGMWFPLGIHNYGICERCEEDTIISAETKHCVDCWRLLNGIPPGL